MTVEKAHEAIMKLFGYSESMIRGDLVAEAVTKELGLRLGAILAGLAEGTVYEGYVIAEGEEECRDEDCPAKYACLCLEPKQRWVPAPAKEGFFSGWEPPLTWLNQELLELEGKRIRVTVEILKDL